MSAHDLEIRANLNYPGAVMLGMNSDEFSDGPAARRCAKERAGKKRVNLKLACYLVTRYPCHAWEATR